MRILGIIPARYASTRFPGKPLHLIAGKPLIQHVVERCQKASALSEIIVATDDNLTDDIPPPPITGEAVAIDLSTSSANVTLNQIAPVAFTDDDAFDDIVSPAAAIVGAIRFGD